MDIMAELEKLRRTHLVVEEDCWYSCPKSGECCNSVQNETNCNCGADEHNEILDGIIKELSKVLKPYNIEQDMDAFLKRCDDIDAMNPPVCDVGLMFMATRAMKDQSVDPEKWWDNFDKKLKTRENVSAIADLASGEEAWKWFEFFSSTPFDTLADK